MSSFILYFCFRLHRLHIHKENNSCLTAGKRQVRYNSPMAKQAIPTIFGSRGLHVALSNPGRKRMVKYLGYLIVSLDCLILSPDCLILSLDFLSLSLDCLISFLSRGDKLTWICPGLVECIVLQDLRRSCCRGTTVQHRNNTMNL